MYHTALIAILVGLLGCLCLELWVLRGLLGILRDLKTSRTNGHGEGA